MKQTQKWWSADQAEEGSPGFPPGADVNSFMQLIVVPLFIALALVLAAGFYLAIE
jgi:hypothetical protein